MGKKTAYIEGKGYNSKHIPRGDVDTSGSTVFYDMSDTVNPDTLKEHLAESSYQLGREVHAVFEKAFADRIKSIQGIIKRTFDKKSRPDETDLEAYVRFYAELRAWLDESSTMVSVVLPPDTLDQWTDHFSDIRKNIPEWLTLEIPEEFWKKQGGESAYIRFAKGWGRTGRSAYRYGRGIYNSARRIFKKAELPWQNAKREVPVQNVVEVAWELPAKSALLHEVFEFFRYRTRFISEVHELTEKVVDLGKKSGEDGPGKSVDDLRKYLEQQSQDLKSYLSDFDNRLDAKVKALAHDFDEIWNEAGTLKRPARGFRGRKGASHQKKLVHAFKEGRSAWEEHVLASRENWLKDLELSTAQLHLLDYEQKVVAITANRINKKLVPVFGSALNRIRRSIEILSDEKNRPDELKEQLLIEGRDLIKSLRQELLPQMTNALVNAHIEQTFQSYQNRARNIQDELSETHSIVREREDTGPIPQVKVDEVPIKELVREEVIERLQNSFAKAMTSLRPRLEMISRSISEIDQIVEYNIEAALQILRDREEEPQEQAWPVLMDGLKRAESKLVSLNQELSEINESIRLNLDDITDTAVNRIDELKDNEEILKLKIRWARAKAKEQIRQFRRNAWNEVKRVVPRLRAIGRFSASHLKTGVSRVKEITGLGEISEQPSEAISRRLIEFQDQVKNMPFVYRRLFRIEPIVSDERLFAGRRTELQTLQKDFDLWKKGVPGAAAIIGERGSGKTTLINDVIKESYTGYSVVTINFVQTDIDPDVFFETLRMRLKVDKAGNWDELYEGLNPDAPVVCIIENMHNLFLRKIGGFGVIDDLMGFISKSRDRIYWVITSGLYGWQYLDKVLRVSRNFSQVIKLHNLDPDEMQEIIMRRHRLSGYNLRLKASDTVEHNRKFRKLNTEQEKQDYLTERLFRNLSEKSDGNIAVAMLLWLNAVTDVGTDYIEIEPDMELDNSFVRFLTTEELFALVVLIQHEVLNASEMAGVLRIDEHDADLLLRQMSNRGYVRKFEVNYSVHPFFYRPIVRSLSTRNMLH